jgi:hypothetical protein
MTMIDQPAAGTWANTSTVVTKAATCPAPQQGGKCGSCRNCWNPEIQKHSLRTTLMWFFKNGTGWCQRYNLESEKKVSSVRDHAPIFRQQAFKRSSSSGSSENLRSAQALKQSNTGRKPRSQGFKPQAIIYKFQDPRSRVQAHKLRVRGPGNEDK